MNFSPLFTPAPITTLKPLAVVLGYPLPPLQNIIEAVIIAASMYMLSKFFWMAYYQAKYGGDMGDRYIRGQITKEEKLALKRRYK